MAETRHLKRPQCGFESHKGYFERNAMYHIGDYVWHKDHGAGYVQEVFDDDSVEIVLAENDGWFTKTVDPDTLTPAIIRYHADGSLELVVDGEVYVSFGRAE